MMNFYRRAATVALLLVFAGILSAQAQRSKVTISGHVTDKASGETLIGAGVVCGNVGSATNAFGFYTLTVPQSGSVTLKYSYIGYDAISVSINLLRDTVVNVALTANTSLKASVVSAQKESGIAATKMSAIEIPMNMIQNTPALLGEADVLKTIQLMPGVQSGAEGFSGIYVRGGGPDENLLLLDGISLYNAEHLLGLFSIFQPEAVKKVTLYKGAFPARYGGRTSSIIDVRTNDGNLQETHGTIGVGILSDKLHIEGPVFKGKTAYSISARGMHTFLFDGIFKAAKVPANYYFYDFNGKVTHKFSDSDRLLINTYYGRDNFYYKEKDNEARSKTEDKSSIRWGNLLAAARWNHIFNGRLFSNTTVAFTDYKMKMGYFSSEKDVDYSDNTKYLFSHYKFNYASGMRDITARIDFDYTPTPKHIIKLGAEYVHHTYMPETSSAEEVENQSKKVLIDTTYSNSKEKNRLGNEMSIYVEDDFLIGSRLALNPGIRLAAFRTGGKTYWSPEPRISVKMDFGKGISAKAAYSRMSQYVHLLSSSQITLPIDLWVPITRNIKPVTSNQYSLGLYYSGLSGWEFSIEGYWKDMRNVLEYKDGVSFLATSQSWESNVVMGDGRAYGVELFIQKTLGKTTGWLGYTLAKSDRIFSNGLINNGERFPYRYDRRHNISLVVNQQLGKKFDLSAVWTFATGGTTTVPERATVAMLPDGTFMQIDYVSHRNNYRLPPSHRLNIGVNYHKKKKRGESIWNFGIYNIYNRLNPNFMFYKGKRLTDNQDPDLSKDAALYVRGEKLKSVTILPIIPSFSYTYKF